MMRVKTTLRIIQNRLGMEAILNRYLQKIIQPYISLMEILKNGALE
jgi:hypothetical protein